MAVDENFPLIVALTGANRFNLRIEPDKKDSPAKDSCYYYCK